jgi:hypothetical protein
MSYSLRVYRQRNPKVQEESKDKPFFPKQKSGQKARGNTSFFQLKPLVNKPGDNLEKAADTVSDRVVNQGKSGIKKKEETSIHRQAAEKGEEKKPDTADSMEKDKEKPVQSKMADQEKERQVTIPKQGDPLKEKETTIQKKAEDVKKEIKKKTGPVEEKDKEKPEEITA